VTELAASRSAGPLAGLRVVEISVYAQGPVAGMILASLGADVVKIEAVGHGDPFRSYLGMYGVQLDDDGRRWIFASVNRGKRCIALDVGSEAGRPVFHRLLADADVFVTNLRPDSLDRLGADEATVRALNPRIVYARGAGFAMRGELASLPCQDTVGMAYSGFMDLVSTTEEPNYPPGAISDVATGSNLASAILAGLVQRSITGQGCAVGTSQVQTMVWLQLFGAGFVNNLGQAPARFDVANPSSPLLSMYATADGWISIGAVNDPQWRVIATTMDLAHLLDDPRFATLPDLIDNTVEGTPILAAAFRSQPTAHWWDLFRSAGIWVAPVNRLGDLASDTSILENEYLVTFPDGSVGTPAPFEVDGWRGARTVASDYGADTDDVLAELGYDVDDVVALRVAGAVF